MDWKSVGQVVGGSAPLIGKLLSVGVSFIPGVGPIIGPIIGPAVGNILAGVFGVPATPDAVAGAIAGNPDEVVKAKLAAATEQIKAQYDWATAVETGELKLEEVAIQQTNATMQAEIGHEHWFFTGWRPAAGWVFDAVALAFGTMLVIAGIVTVWKSPEPLKSLSDAWPLFLAYFGVLGAIVGVYIPSRTAEKKAAIENSVAMPNAVVPEPQKPSAIVVTPKLKGVIPAPAGSRS